MHIAGNKLATGVAVNDGLWHHVAIVWTGKAMKDKDGKKHKGQLLVYVNHVLLHRGEGQTNGAEHLANAAGSFALGSGAGSRSSFEGYLAARMITEALTRAGKNPTRQSLVQALESINDLDLGGFQIQMGRDDHNASDFVELTFLGSQSWEP